jgi:endonuclease YncB( thermonuclease family)
MKHIQIFILFLLPISLLSQDVIVKAVHDGDSYRVQFEDGHHRWIRLYGVDAPEVQSNHVTATQTYGREAGNNIRSLIKGKKVRLDSCLTDQFNRIVGKIYYDTIDLTEYCILSGNGWWLNNAGIPEDELNQLKAIQSSSQDHKNGLWGMPGKKIRPSTFRKNHRN